MERLFYFVEQDIMRGLIIIAVCLLATLVACVFDFLSKLDALKAARLPIESRPIAKTGKKIIDYYKLIFYVFMADFICLLCFSIWMIPYCVVVITIGILYREGKSMYENNKLRKSASAEVVEIASKIVQCVTEDEAKKLIKAINEVSNVKHKEK